MVVTGVFIDPLQGPLFSRPRIHCFVRNSGVSSRLAALLGTWMANRRLGLSKGLDDQDHDHEFGGSNRFLVCDNRWDYLPDM